MEDVTDTEELHDYPVDDEPIVEYGDLEECNPTLFGVYQVSYIQM